MRIVSTPLLFWADGMTVAPGLVLVHPRVRRDAGLLAHEAVHCRQMREVGLLRFWWWYFSCPAFRLWAEVEAYRVSLRHQPRGLRHFARALAQGYLLDVDEERVQRLLRGEPALTATARPAGSRSPTGPATSRRPARTSG